MISDIHFQPVGHFKACDIVSPAVFIVDSQQELQKLWNTFPIKRNADLNVPTVDFTTKKILVVKERLSSISCYLFVHKIQMVAKETLHIECSEMNDGGACAATMGTAYQFLAVDRNLQFTNVKINRLEAPPAGRTYEDHWLPEMPSIIEILDKIPL